MNIVAPDPDGLHPARDAPAGLGIGPALADRAVRVGVLGEAHVLRAALIVTLALADAGVGGPVDGVPSGSPAPTGDGPRHRRTRAPGPRRRGPRWPSRRRRFTLTVVVDLACPVDSRRRAGRAHLRTRPSPTSPCASGSPRGPRGPGTGCGSLVTAAEAGATVTWAPGAVRRLAPVALPAVYLRGPPGTGRTGHRPAAARGALADGRCGRSGVDDRAATADRGASRDATAARPRAGPAPPAPVPPGARGGRSRRPRAAKRYPVCLTRSLLSRRAGLAGAPGRARGGAQPGRRSSADTRGSRPTSVRGSPSTDSAGRGAWPCPGRSGTFAALREIRTARDLRPVGSRLVEVAPGVVERRHRIPLRYHPGAWLIVAVCRPPRGPGALRRLGLARGTASRQRALVGGSRGGCIELFRDLAASWFWVGPPPVAAGAGSNGRPSTTVTDASDQASTPHA